MKKFYDVNFFQIQEEKKDHMITEVEVRVRTPLKMEADKAR